MILRTTGLILRDCRNDFVIRVFWIAAALSLLPWLLSLFDWSYWTLATPINGDLNQLQVRFVMFANVGARWIMQFALLTLIALFLWSRERGRPVHRMHGIWAAAAMMTAAALFQIALDTTYLALAARAANLPEGLLWTMGVQAVFHILFALFRITTAVALCRQPSRAFAMVVITALLCAATRNGGLVFDAPGPGSISPKLIVLAMLFYAALAALVWRVRADSAQNSGNEEHDTVIH